MTNQIRGNPASEVVWDGMLGILRTQRSVVGRRLTGLWWGRDYAGAPECSRLT